MCIFEEKRNIQEVFSTVALQPFTTDLTIAEQTRNTQCAAYYLQTLYANKELKLCYNTHYFAYVFIKHECPSEPLTQINEKTSFECYHAPSITTLYLFSKRLMPPQWPQTKASFI